MWTDLSWFDICICACLMFAGCAVVLTAGPRRHKTWQMVRVTVLPACMVVSFAGGPTVAILTLGFCGLCLSSFTPWRRRVARDVGAVWPVWDVSSSGGQPLRRHALEMEVPAWIQMDAQASQRTEQDGRRHPTPDRAH